MLPGPLQWWSTPVPQLPVHLNLTWDFAILLFSYGTSDCSGSQNLASTEKTEHRHAGPGSTRAVNTAAANKVLSFWSSQFKLKVSLPIPTYIVFWDKKAQAEEHSWRTSPVWVSTCAVPSLHWTALWFPALSTQHPSRMWISLSHAPSTVHGQPWPAAKTTSPTSSHSLCCLFTHIHIHTLHWDTALQP